MVVEHRAAKVVGGCYGVHIACKVQVDVLHRQYLSVTAAGGAALDAENGAERRLTQRDDRFFADLSHSLTQACGGGGFALTCGRGVDRRDQNQLTVGIALNARAQLVRQLCLVLSVKLQLILGNADLRRHFPDGQKPRLLGDFNIS